MVNLELILLNLVQPLVDDPTSISVKQMESLNDKEILLYVYAKEDDLARLIGRKGVIANALRQMMLVPAKSHEKRISIKFEAY